MFEYLKRTIYLIIIFPSQQKTIKIHNIQQAIDLRYLKMLDPHTD